MARRMRLDTHELGFLEVLAIKKRGGAWEVDWDPVRGTEVGDLFTVVPRETLDHALHGFSKPLVDALGPPPAGCLRKLPKAFRTCHKRRECPLYIEKVCHPFTTKQFPWCYEPQGLSGEEVRQCATKAIEQWREGVYLLIIEEPDA